MLPAAPPLDRIDDNILSEILLRLPPLPSSLPRASAVSKRWHGLASDPDFRRRFRRHHRRNPPVLGFFSPRTFLTFVPTLDAPNRVPPGRFSLQYNQPDRYVSCGSRHGLLFIFDKHPAFRHVLVWDPITGDQERIDIPLEFENYAMIGGAVLRDAGDVHFRVVLVVGDTEHYTEDRRALARVYSSVTNSWDDLVSMPLPPEANMMRLYTMVVMYNPAVLVGDSLYWQLVGSISGILEFNLERQRLNVIRVPVEMHPDFFSVTREEDGGLGFLFVSGFTAQLWKTKTDSDGIVSWVLGRTIELDKLLSLDPDEHEHISVLGYAEENNCVFLGTVIGLFVVQLQSLQFTFMKDSKTANMDSYHPFESVFAAGT